MKERFVRTEMLLGEEAMNRLEKKRVAVFGIGGVGGYVIEALARSGIGALDIIDHDVVSESNLNRQIIALESTLGRKKTEVMEERIAQINKECVVTAYDAFYLPQEAERFPFSRFDYIVDAVDTVTAKIDLVLQAQKYGISIISSMGTGNKLNPALLQVADIYQTAVCPLARVMRRELKNRGVKACKVVYSREPVMEPLQRCGGDSGRRATPGSTAFVPATAGLLIASEVIRELTGQK